MDLVYPLKKTPGGAFQELRYSLRSVRRNLPHDNVYVYGGKPDWLANAEWVPTSLKKTKWEDSRNNQIQACLDPRVSDPFILMNDDFFVMKPVPDGVPSYNRGTIRQLLEWYHSQGINSKYTLGAEATLEKLESMGFKDPLSFDLHVPLVVDKATMLRALKLAEGHEAFHSRSAYGALAGLQGDYLVDPKVHGTSERLDGSLTFVSTSDPAWQVGRSGILIRSKFRQRSRYEKTP